MKILIVFRKFVFTNYKKMSQEIATYVLLLLATIYVGRRIYNSIKKKNACDKCALMDATKIPAKKN